MSRSLTPPRDVIFFGAIVFAMISADPALAQNTPLGDPAPIAPVGIATKIKWTIDLIVPIAMHEIAIHRYGDDFPTEPDGNLDYVRWFAVWRNSEEDAYSAVPIDIRTSSSAVYDLREWLSDWNYVADDWTDEAWIGTSIPISDSATSSPVYRADLRDFRLQRNP